MPYLLVVRDAANRDAQKAYNYYESMRQGLGDRFLEQLQTVYTSLSLYPTNFSFIDSKKKLRDRVLKVFPYVVIYKIEEETVIVVAVHKGSITMPAKQGHIIEASR